jgi:transcriptional regulator with GAF, ATPase, and Fis domain
MGDIRAAAYTMNAAPPPPSRTGGRCFGREQELTQLLQRFEQAVAGTSAFVLVTGDPGAGKSTLLAEAARRLRDRGALVLEARCRPDLASYRPLLEIVRHAIGHLAQEGEPLDDATYGLLETLEGRRGAEDLSDGLDLAARRVSFFDRLADFLVAASARRPTVVVMHDLGLADPGTLQAVRHLGRVLTGHPSLSATGFHGLVLASADSPGAVSPEPSWELAHLQLGGLDDAGLRAYFSSDEVVARVRSATGGVPGRLNVLVDHRVAPDAGVSPALADLGPSERRALEMLAVFGRPMGPETLRLLTGLPQERLARTIAALGERHLLEKVVVDGELRLGFARASDQRAVYEEMPLERRRESHASVGDYLEAAGDAESEACADHLLRAACGNRAVRMALAAGQRLEIAFCFERAADLYEKALEHVESEATREELLERLCNVCELTGRLDAAVAHAEIIRQRRPQELEAALRVAHLHRIRGDFAAARAELRSLRDQLSAETTPRSVQARVLAVTAEVQFLAGESEKALSTASTGLGLCRVEGPEVDEGLVGIRLSLQNTLAKIHAEREEHDAAGALLCSNLALARAAGLPKDEGIALDLMGLIHLRSGRCAEAEECFNQARTLAEATGQTLAAGICLQHLAILAERQADYGAALDLYQSAVGSFKRAGHRSYLAWVGLDLGKLYLKLGDVPRASAMVALAERLVDADPPAATRISLELLRGLIAQRECRYQEAHDRLAAARELALATGQREREARCRLEMAGLAMERGKAAEALRVLDEEGGFPRSEPLRLQALVLQARAKLQVGELQSAHQHLAEALELSEAVGDSESRWQARYYLALVAQQQGRRAEAGRLLSEAATMEERIRATVPAEFRALLGDQPARIALRQALHGGASGARAVALLGRDGARVGGEEKERELHLRWRYGGIIGAHRRMQQVYDYVERVATTDTTVLIQGESGTGKELIAEAIHRRSKRSGKPLVKVNCGALVESLLLSELFGHERGAFTGALQRKKGRFEVADGGTIFLDEIGDISPKTQVALLRVLQEREFERVGGVTPLRVDVRIICATNRNLEEMVARGAFREDLYYRLNGMRLEVPPLRERIEDLPLIIDHVLGRIAQERSAPRKRLSATAEELLSRYGWPGNVRELENVLRSATLFADVELLGPDAFADFSELARLAAEGQSDKGASAAGPTEGGQALGPYLQVRSLGWSLKEYKKHIEVECITSALAEASGNITRAAELLGMKRPRLSQLIKEHGIALS